MYMSELELVSLCTKDLQIGSDILADNVFSDCKSVGKTQIRVLQHAFTSASDCHSTLSALSLSPYNHPHLQPGIVISQSLGENTHVYTSTANPSMLASSQR